MAERARGGEAAAQAAARAGARARRLRPALVATGIALLIVAGRQLGALAPAFQARVEGLGAWGPLVFMAGYVLAVLAFVPGSLLTLAGGAVFGLARGTAYVFVAALIGATLAFLVARHLARPWVERRIAADPRFAAIDRAIAAQGGRIVFLLRLSPLLPFNLLNYALGLTRVRLRDYLLASAGMLPGTLLYVYSGSLAGELARAAGGTRSRSPAEWALLALGLVATVAATHLVARLARQALRGSAGEDLA
ncbi:MAG: TVP38/TMEM64 family protein [Deltaproteobacteria bacterium]|nr:TVP38/TMEM64 family protein [Deltaproteobacteria bacterium]